MKEAVRPPASGLIRGLNKGFIVTRKEMPPKPSNRKGRKSQRVAMVREVIREVAGFAPYERRMLELIKIGSAATLKRCLKFAKNRLGDHRRARRKREELVDAIREMKKKAQQ